MRSAIPLWATLDGPLSPPDFGRMKFMPAGISRKFNWLGVLFYWCFSLACFSSAADAYRNEITTQTILKTQTDSAGHKIAYPSAGTPEVSGVVVQIPVGKQTGWHIHTVPCFAYVLEGEVTVEWEDGSQHTIKAGEAFAEVVNLKHNGSNRGTVPAKLVMFVVGSKDTPIAIKQ